MKKIWIIGGSLLLFVVLIGYWFYPQYLKLPGLISIFTSPTPSPTHEPSKLPYIILDFEEAIKFNSIEETKNYRFRMSVGKDYEIQKNWVYQYLGDGKIRIKDFSDPDFVKETGFIVQVGYPFAIGFVPPAEGRHYLVMPIEVGSRDLILRIEKIME